MTPNKRDLKAYVRFDGTGRIVPSSLILRRKKPKVGKWVEVQAYECCNYVCPPLVNGDDFILANIIPGDPGFANIIVLINPFESISIQGELVGCDGSVLAVSDVLSTLFPAENVWIVPEADLFATCTIKFRRVCDNGNSTWVDASAPIVT